MLLTGSKRIADLIDAAFGHQTQLADAVFAALGATGNGDGSHDRSHLLRVWRNATAIAADEPGCDHAILAAAVILHDCVAVEKNAADRALASGHAAARARVILCQLGWEAPRIERVAHAIEAHSFSAGIAPLSLEARILQDADRLDAIGAIGIARCFYVAGRMGSSLYDAADPIAADRALDDQRFALDHFAVKLFKIAGEFQTRSGQAMADARRQGMQCFVSTFMQEISGASV